MTNQTNDFDPSVLWEEFYAGRLTKEELDELIANSSQAAWQNCQESWWRREKLQELDIALQNGEITLAQYKKKQREFPKEMKRNNIPTFEQEYPEHFQYDAAQKVVVLSGHKAQGQSRAKKPARRTTKKAAAKSDSSDGDGGDGEPPRQQYFTYASFAQLVDCTTRTLYNKVSTGQFPKPLKTAFGPRFTQQHLDSILVKPAQKGRGRPRIADQLGRGGAA